MGRQSQYHPPRNEWEKRVNPAFRQNWSADKAMRLTAKIKDEKEQMASWHQAFQEKSVASRLLNEERKKLSSSIAAKVGKAISAPLDGERKFEAGTLPMTYAVNPESEPVFRYLVFLKHGITFRSLIMEIEKDRRAHRKPSRATAIAAKLPQQSVSSGEVVVTPSAEAVVGPHSLHTEAEVAVDGLSGVPHPVSERDRAVAEAQLTDKGLPEGKVSSAVAGYLYFSIVPRKKQSVLLDYEQNGTKVVLRFSEKPPG